MKKTKKLAGALIFLCLTITLGSSLGWGQLAKRLMGIRSDSGINLVISSNTDNYNIFTAAGSPAVAGPVTVTILAGVVVGSSSTATPAMDTGTFPVGTVLKIVNNGIIVGKGGTGGKGGDANPEAGFPGTDGGPALALNYPVTIVNNGKIWGGGGGGGGGGD